MSGFTASLAKAVDGWGRALRAAGVQRGPHRRKILQWWARAGYSARGLVYLMAGALSLMASLELRESAAGTSQVLTTFGGWYFGGVWLFTIGAALIGFTTWRFVQAVFDPEGHGTSLKGLVHRVGCGISGLIYGALGYSALDLSDSLAALRPEHPDHPVVQSFLGTPFGDEILLVVGLCVLVGAVGNGMKAFSRKLDGHLACSDAVRRWAVPLGRVGYLSRALVFLLLGGFLVETALDLAQADFVSLGEALQSLEAQPRGSLLLGAAALGLMAFGAFGLVEACCSRIPIPRELA